MTKKQNKKKSTTKSNKNVSRFILNTTPKPNTIKSVHFTSLKQGPMGDAVIEGYINNNKKMILLHLHHLKTIINLEADLQQTLKYLNYLNRLMNLNHPMKSKRFRQKKEH